MGGMSKGDLSMDDMSMGDMSMGGMSMGGMSMGMKRKLHNECSASMMASNGEKATESRVQKLMRAGLEGGQKGGDDKMMALS